MKKELIKIIISSILFIISFIINNIYIKDILLIISYLIVGIDVIINAFKNILNKEFLDENTLMTISTLGALYIGEIPEAVCVMLFYSIGELVCDYGVEKSKKSILDLNKLKSDTVNLYKNKKIEVVNTDEVNINDIILVKPGEIIGLDGVVIDGSSYVDTSSLTGESLPKQVNINDEVLSGFVNMDSIIKIKVTSKYEESTINKVLKLVEESQNTKSKEEKFITKFAKIYTPVVVILAILITVIPTLIFNKTFDIYFYRSLSFLVISCPCALVISVPLTFFSAIGASSKLGILIKGTNNIETLSNINMIVCDKTGTLTKGAFKVKEINNINIDKKKLLMYTAYSEFYSNHPIAISIKNEYGKKIDEKEIKNIKEISGMGVYAEIFNDIVILGNDKLMNKYKIKYDKVDCVSTALYVAINNEYKGYILIDDEIKEDAYRAINKFKENDIEVIMLTGDKKEKALDISKQLNIDKCYYELLPNDKVNIIKELKKDNKIIFIGDGINDAPVLKYSDVGISMGNIGSDTAINASDVVILTDEISKVDNLIKICNKSMKIVKENIIFSIAVKIIILLFSMFGLCNMWQAVFADVGVTIITVLNSFRVFKYNK